MTHYIKAVQKIVILQVIIMILFFSNNYLFVQILYHLGFAWEIRWPKSSFERIKLHADEQKVLSDPVIPTMDQVFVSKTLSTIG